MPANDFEKQAKQLLEEVNIRPDEKVWLEVEKRIREKKRRRWMIIFPLLAALSIAGYFIADSFNNDTDNPSAVAITKNTGGSETEKDNELSKTDENKLKNNLSVAPAENEKEKINKKEIVSPVSTDRTVLREKPLVKLVNVKKQIAAKKDKPFIAFNKTSIKKEKTIPGLSVSKKETAIVDKNNTEAKEKKNAEPVSSATAKDSVFTETPPENKTADAVKATEPVSNAEQKTEVGKIINSAAAQVKPEIKKQNKSKWQLGFSFSGGASNIKSKVFGLDLGMEKAFDAVNPVQSGANPAPVKYPSSNYAAFAFQPGLYLQKNISKRSAISIGLNYAMYQTKIKVGGIVDTVIMASNASLYTGVRNAVSVAGPAYDYYSRLHYIELPVLFSTQLNRSKKLPLHWDAGISIAQLLSSNYLHFDSVSRGIYFKDNRLLNKTNISLQTGFGLTFFTGSKMPVTVGPHIQFGLSDLLKEKDDKRYLLYGGIKLQLLLSKKKN